MSAWSARSRSPGRRHRRPRGRNRGGAGCCAERDLTVPWGAHARGVVAFAHGSGSSQRRRRGRGSAASSSTFPSRWVRESPFPLRALQREQRVDRDRVPRAQSDPLDRPTRPPRPHTTDRKTPPLPALRAPRPTDPHRPTRHTALPRPLALATRVHRSAHPHPSAPRRRLRSPGTPPPHPAQSEAPGCPRRPPAEPPPRPNPERSRPTDGLNWPHPHEIRSAILNCATTDGALRSRARPSM